ncbi:MAG: hypothetical protein AB7S26_30325 [Sandaracinaceae bacterium]
MSLATRIALVSALAAATLPASRGLAQPPSSAHAQNGARSEVTGEVLIVLATEQAGPIDPDLARVAALRRPPFSQYRSMSLLSSPRVRLRVGQAQEVELPNGRRMRLILREITARGRFRLQVSVNRPGERDYLPEVNVVTSPGDPFFIAGQSYDDGTLVIGIRLGEHPPA